MKRDKTEKLKRMHIVPIILVLIIVIVFVYAALVVIAGAITYNLTRGKMSQGYKWALTCYEKLEAIDKENANALDEVFANCTYALDDITGVTIKEGDKILYTNGDVVSEDKTKIDDVLSADLFFEDNNNTVNVDKVYTSCELYFDTTDSSFFKRFASGDVMYIFTTFMDFFVHEEEKLGNSDINELMIDAIFTQRCYYEFVNADGTIYYITFNVYITAEEAFIVVLVFLCVVLICFIYFVFVIYMIIRALANQRRILKLYYADKETGGKNWYYFLEKAARKMKRYRRKNINAAMVHIRMEKYRSYCSCYGDAEGRRLLGDFYEVIRHNITGKECFARHEMCDFGLLLCYDTADSLVNRVEHIMDMLDEQRPGIKLYFHAGINVLDKEAIEPSEAYNRAAVARRRLTEGNDENINFFTQDMREELLWERRVENEMERALLGHEYKVYLQPKYSVGNEKLAAAEALVRWMHPTQGLIAPYKFIPIFEENGFITKLDDYMIEEVAKLQAKWISQGKKIVPISVNVSRANFTREDLAEHICGLIDKYNVPHDYIELELTESAFFDDKETLINIVKKMKACSFAVSMDDFGAGYSSLNSLKELPVDVVKLDAEFFRGNDEEGKGKVIVEEAIGLAKKLNMRIVAEGIETREQVDFLADNKCDLIQGYYFAKPMPVNEFEVRVEQDGV